MVTVRQVNVKMLRVACALVIVATTALAAQAATASWDPNTEPNLAGYKLSYGMQPGVHVTTIDVGNVTTCQFNPGPGVYYVVVQAYDTDGLLSGKSAEVMINIAGTVKIDVFVPVNRPPTFAQPQSQSSTRGANVSLALAASDPDGSAVTFSASALPPGLSLNTASGLIAGVVSQTGSYQVTVTVSDGALSVSRSFTWTVNEVSVAISASSRGGPVVATPALSTTTSDAGASVSPTVPVSNSGAPVVSTLAVSTNASVTTSDAGATVTNTIPASNSGAPEVSAEALSTDVSVPAASELTADAVASQPPLENSDLGVLGDFDGDGRSDLATYRPSAGEWRIWTSQSGFTGPMMVVWGMTGDLPMAADYDGDRVTDTAVYRPSTGSWHVWLSRSQTQLVVQWGDGEDRPVALDHDGDGKADLALIRDGGYEILLSRTNYLTSVTVR